MSSRISTHARSNLGAALQPTDGRGVSAHDDQRRESMLRRQLKKACECGGIYKGCISADSWSFFEGIIIEQELNRDSVGSSTSTGIDSLVGFVVE